MAVGATSGFGLGDIRGVTMDVKDHASDRISDGCTRIGRGVVEKPNYLVIGLLGG